MDMEVGYLLPAIGADIGKQAIAGLYRSGLACDDPDGTDKTSDFSVRSACGEVVP